jgi:Rod binding domain-containing protein
MPTAPTLAPGTLAPGLTPSLPGFAPKTASAAEKARSTSQDFEAVFINSMLQQMFAGVGEGPFGGGHAANVWRSFLTDEYAKSFAKNGGIGIADHVYRSLLAQQEVRSSAATRTSQGSTAP